MNRHNHKDVRKRVLRILQEVPAARESYDVLYVEFLKTIDPGLADQPFYMTMTNTQIPSYQSVERTSRHIKKEYEELRESADNKAKRDEIEQSYMMEYGRF